MFRLLLFDLLVVDFGVRLLGSDICGVWVWWPVGYACYVVDGLTVGGDACWYGY